MQDNNSGAASNTAGAASNTRAAVVQMLSSDDIAANLESAGRLIAQAVAAGAELVVLPEMFASLGTRDAIIHSIQTDRQHTIIDWLCGQACQYSVWIVAGSIPFIARCSDDNSSAHKPFARCLVIDSTGDIAASYDKIHLFDANVDDGQGCYRESDSFAAGSDIVLVKTPIGRMGLSICYDLRFPELFRAMFQRGVDVLVVPSAFTQVTGEAHWHTLLRARAIENCCYLLAANQGGVHSDKRVTYGHSMIISPWGEVLGILESGEGVVVADIDLGYRQKISDQLPCHQHQRLLVPDNIH